MFVKDTSTLIDPSATAAVLGAWVNNPRPVPTSVIHHLHRANHSVRRSGQCDRLVAGSGPASSPQVRDLLGDIPITVTSEAAATTIRCPAATTSSARGSPPSHTLTRPGGVAQPAPRFCATHSCATCAESCLSTVTLASSSIRVAVSSFADTAFSAAVTSGVLACRS